jgi:hypothetical protein
MCTNKTNTGHLEGGAAMTTLIAATLQVRAGHAIPIVHFRRLNPNLEQSNFDFLITNETLMSKFQNNNVHISSFGFGGTNAHCILFGCVQSEVINPEAIVLQRIRKMAPPEVRVNGDDPSMWEWDGPDENVKPGDKYSLNIDTQENALRCTKEEDGDEPHDGIDDFYCITGPFNDWEADRMEDGAVAGLRTTTLATTGGAVQFRFLRNGEEDEVLYPEYDQCTSRTAAVLGPAPGQKNTWYVECPAGKSLQVDLFVCRGRRSVMWMFV